MNITKSNNMKEENTTKTKKPGYSEMLIQLVQEFEKKMPNELSLQERVEIGIEAWNLAITKVSLDELNLYEKELKSYKNKELLNEMVNYKLEHFSNLNNIIIDFTLTGNKLQVKSQSPENRFDNLIRAMVNREPMPRSKK